jgi:hypothetical protein
MGQNAALQQAQAQYGIGSGQQQQRQAELSTAYQNYLNQIGYPYQQAQFQGGLISGVASGMGGTTASTATPAQPGGMNQVIGGLGALGSLGSLFGGGGGGAGMMSGFGAGLGSMMGGIGEGLGPQLVRVSVRLSESSDLAEWSLTLADGKGDTVLIPSPNGIERAVALSNKTFSPSGEGAGGGEITLELDATGLPKGPGSLRFEVRDSYGNVAETRMPVIKDGMAPVIAYPHPQDFIDTVIAISGQVMDPDFTNTQAMQKYKLLYKRGQHTVAIPADVGDFIVDPEVAWVPARHRKGGGDFLASEGNVEIRGQDILGYFNPRAAGIEDGEVYTLALAVYEEGLGITAVVGVPVTVLLPQAGELPNTGGVGGLLMMGLQARYPETVPTVGVTVQLQNGAGDISVE